MFDNKKIGDQHRNVCCRVDARMAMCCVLMSGVLLPWGAYADAEEFATVHIGETANVNVHADSQPLAVQNLDAPAVVDVNDKESIPIDIDPDLSDVVQLDTSKGDKNSQLDLAGPRDMQSLDVVDTASPVKLSHAVDDMGGGIGDQKANVDLGDQPMAALSDMVDQGGEFGAGFNDMIEQGEQSLVAVVNVNLPVTNTADAHSRNSDAGGQLKDASNDAAGEESAGLPYAVVLALLALIGLVPVARRNDQHHV